MYALEKSYVLSDATAQPTVPLFLRRWNRTYVVIPASDIFMFLFFFPLQIVYKDFFPQGTDLMIATLKNLLCARSTGVWGGMVILLVECKCELLQKVGGFSYYSFPLALQLFWVCLFVIWFFLVLFFWPKTNTDMEQPGCWCMLAVAAKCSVWL